VRRDHAAVCAMYAIGKWQWKMEKNKNSKLLESFVKGAQINNKEKV